MIKNAQMAAQELFIKFWAYMSSDDMVLNLTSEVIGMFITLIVVSMFGGWLVQRSAARSFEKKWSAFREDLASWVLESQKQLEEDFFYLGKDMIKIAEKDDHLINSDDLADYRRKRMACQTRCSELMSIFERAHFALRKQDISPASKYVKALRSGYHSKLQAGFSSFEQFDTRITMHLQGLAILQNKTGGTQSPTYREILISSAKEADRLIMKTDRHEIARLGEKLAAQLVKKFS